MPQNKSTSRIAAITGKLAVALAALLAPAILIAETISVTFDAALTNETGWAYHADVKINNKGLYVSGHNAKITSPAFDFAITSVVISVSATQSCTRNLIVSAYNHETNKSRLERIYSEIEKGGNSVITASWDASDLVTSISLTSTEGEQNLYLVSATIHGAAIVPPPTNLAADNVKGTRFTLKWENPETAMSNRVAVFRVDRHSESGTTLDEYDFTAFTNTAKNAKDCYSKDTLKMDVYNAFCGTNIYAAGNSTGVVQISSPDAQGWLRYDFGAIRESLDDATNVSLILSAKKHPTDASGNWGLLITVATADGAAINATTNNLAEEFPATPFIIPLQNVTANEILVLQPSDATKKNRRILIDYLAFIRDYSPANTSTNLVKTAFVADSTTYSIRGLCPRTEYVARITAFDAEGNESSPSEPLAVTTNGEAIPFSIRIQ